MKHLVTAVVLSFLAVSQARASTPPTGGWDFDVTKSTRDFHVPGYLKMHGSTTTPNSTSITLDGTLGKITATTVVAAVTGNATSATALAANGTNCSAGQYPLGVDASGNAESCTAAGVGDAVVSADNAWSHSQTIVSPSTLTIQGSTFHVGNSFDVTSTSTSVKGNFSVAGTSFTVVNGVPAAPSMPRISAYITYAQTIANGVETTLYFSGSLYATGGMQVPASSSNTIPIPITGYYDYYCTCYMTATTSNSGYISARKNASAMKLDYCSDQGTRAQCQVSGIISFVAGDTVGCALYSGSGTNNATPNGSSVCYMDVALRP